LSLVTFLGDFFSNHPSNSNFSVDIFAAVEG
jgi:hypothetical protein